MIQRLDHVNLVVRDLDAMTAFYAGALGLRITKQVRISGPWIEAVVGLAGVDADVVYLEADAPAPDGVPGTRIELIRYRAPAGGADPGPAVLGAPNTPGLRHLAFTVTDIDGLVQRMTAAGVRFFGPVQAVPDAQVTYAGGVRKRLVYFHDPEGNLLELCEYR